MRPIVTREQYQALLAKAGDVDWRYRLALVLAHETGHRIGAIRKLKWSDVDLKAGECAGGVTLTSRVGIM